MAANMTAAWPENVNMPDFDGFPIYEQAPEGEFETPTMKVYRLNQIFMPQAYFNIAYPCSMLSLELKSRKTLQAVV